MRRSLILAALALAPACSTTHSAPSISADPGLRDPKADFDVLRSLAGDWVAWGADSFEVRFLVLDGGKTVEAVMLGGTPNDAVLTYRLDHDRITMIQRPSGGESLPMSGVPSHELVHVKRTGTYSEIRDACNDTITVRVNAPNACDEITPLSIDVPVVIDSEPDPSLHEFTFKPTESADVNWPKAGHLVGAELYFSPEYGVSLAWLYTDTIAQYHLMRKHPAGVERTADHSVPPWTWDKMNRHFDLRDDPAYKAEAH